MNMFRRIGMTSKEQRILYKYALDHMDSLHPNLTKEQKNSLYRNIKIRYVNILKVLTDKKLKMK